MYLKSYGVNLKLVAPTTYSESVTGDQFRAYHKNETLRHCLLIQKASGCGNYFKGLSQWNLFLAALEDTFRSHTEKIRFLSLMVGIQIVKSVVVCACVVVPKSLDFVSKSVIKER